MKEKIIAFLSIPVLLFVSLFLIPLSIRCEDKDKEKCYRCEIRVIYLNSCPLKETTGIFEMCDITKEEMEYFEIVNTYADSTFIQTCNCK